MITGSLSRGFGTRLKQINQIERIEEKKSKEEVPVFIDFLNKTNNAPSMIETSLGYDLDAIKNSNENSTIIDPISTISSIDEQSLPMTTEWPDLSLFKSEENQNDRSEKEIHRDTSSSKPNPIDVVFQLYNLTVPSSSPSKTRTSHIDHSNANNGNIYINDNGDRSGESSNRNDYDPNTKDGNNNNRNVINMNDLIDLNQKIWSKSKQFALRKIDSIPFSSASSSSSLSTTTSSQSPSLMMMMMINNRMNEKNQKELWDEKMDRFPLPKNFHSINGTNANANINTDRNNTNNGEDNQIESNTNNSDNKDNNDGLGASSNIRLFGNYDHHHHRLQSRQFKTILNDILNDNSNGESNLEAERKSSSTSMTFDSDHKQSNIDCDEKIYYDDGEKCLNGGLISSSSSTSTSKSSKTSEQISTINSDHSTSESMSSNHYIVVDEQQPQQHHHHHYQPLQSLIKDVVETSVLPETIVFDPNKVNSNIIENHNGNLSDDDLGNDRQNQTLKPLVG